MLKDITQVKPLEGYNLWLRFEDGIEGTVDVSQLVEFKGVFAPLADREFFNRAQVNPDTGTIAWPNDTDLDPDVLYALVTGAPLPTFQKATARA